MNSPTKVFGLGLISTAVTLVLLFLVVKYLFNESSTAIKVESEKYRVHVGDDYVLNGDTLIITDYSLFTETFTLSNGVEVNYHLVVNSNK